MEIGRATCKKCLIILLVYITITITMASYRAEEVQSLTAEMESFQLSDCTAHEVKRNKSTLYATTKVSLDW